MKLSVIICTYNPRKDYLDRVLKALQMQTLDKQLCELVIVDNKSDTELIDLYDLSWHPHGRIVREEQPGLAHARIRGVQETTGEIIVFVDDDNVLQADYLEQAMQIMQERPHLGSIGGKAIPEYEVQPPVWFKDFGLIGCRDLGDTSLFTTYYEDQTTHKVNIENYPSCAPIGTGQVIHRTAFLAYRAEVSASRERTALGRTGKKLISGEDNDIVLTVLRKGWDVGYFPELYVTHLIPARRVKASYLAKLNQAMFRSWVYVLQTHDVNPWPPIPAWSVWPRKIKSYITQQAWKGKVNYIKWRGTCGMYEGLAEIYQK